MVTNETAGRHVAGGPRITRRRLLAYAAATPTLSVVVKLADAVVGPGGAPPAGAQVAGIVDFTDALTLAAAPTQHLLVVEVTEENRVVARLPRAEVGQGITTAVAQIVADEIGARLEDTDVVLEDARPELLWNQLTGGSNTVHALYTPLRVAAAGARARLITAAARRWGVSASGLVTADTTVTGPGGRSATFGELSAAAASVTVPAVPAVPKDPSQHTLIGQPTTRIDARDIVTGKARYTQDLPIPDALTCVVARPPTLGGTVRSVDDRAARAVPGVVDVVRIPTGVAVVAETFDQALAARDAQRRRRRAVRPGRAVAVGHEPDRHRPDRGAHGRPARRPRDGPRGAGRGIVRAPPVLRPGAGGRPGVQGRRPARAAAVDPQRRHAPRPPPPRQPPPGPGHAAARQPDRLRAPHGFRHPRRQPRPRRAALRRRARGARRRRAGHVPPHPARPLPPGHPDPVA